MLWQEFGLCVQVFRKSGNHWIETSLTNSWTLEQQNREGFELSSFSYMPPYKRGAEIDFMDCDLGIA
jgi:hypothetical protein